MGLAVWLNSFSPAAWAQQKIKKDVENSELRRRFTYSVPLSTIWVSSEMPSRLMNSWAKVMSRDALAKSFRASSFISRLPVWMRSCSCSAIWALGVTPTEQTHARTCFTHTHKIYLYHQLSTVVIQDINDIEEGEYRKIEHYTVKTWTVSRLSRVEISALSPYMTADTERYFAIPGWHAKLSSKGFCTRGQTTQVPVHTVMIFIPV